MKYLSRIYDSLLEEKLQAKGATLVEGPKWCGKTTTASQVCASELLMHDPKTKARNLELSEIDPQALLAGATCVLSRGFEHRNHQELSSVRTDVRTRF